ncbi:lauroyl acyltransferase [Ferrovibrio sp.]|uniref:LpxL/LpxP family acyltransferase n=1 Tax=Ferrovibrio sp. TaxID=1917215 RepID=UPI0035B10A41
MFKLRAEPHEYVAYWGARVALGLFGLLPLEQASAFGGWLGRKLGPKVPVHRMAARQLQRAMPELSEAEQEKILTGMWDNLGRVLAEYAHLEDIAVGKHIELVGGEYIRDVTESGKSAIFVSGHYGNWELISHAGRHYGLPMVLVYRAANNPLTEELLQSLRAPIGAKHVPKGVRAARALLQALHANQSLGMLVDQKQNTGIPVPFFGQDAMTAPAIAELALRMQCPVIPVRVIRLDGGRFRIEVSEPLHLPASGDRDADVLAVLKHINTVLEGWIRERPDHWFWVHRRWPKD